MCKTFTALRDGQTGSYTTIDQYNNVVTWEFSLGKLWEFSIQGMDFETKVDVVMMSTDPNCKFTHNSNRNFIWLFQHGKLGEVTITTQNDLPFQGEVELIASLYGKPVMETVSLQNALGAHWQRSVAVWLTSDETTILVSEATEFQKEGKLGVVSFKSKEFHETSKPTVNPY